MSGAGGGGSLLDPTRALQNVYEEDATVSQLRQVLQSAQIAQPPTELLKTHARLRKQSGRPESRGEYLERNYDDRPAERYAADGFLRQEGAANGGGGGGGGGYAYAGGSSNAYDHEMALQNPVSTAHSTAQHSTAHAPTRLRSRNGYTALHCTETMIQGLTRFR